MNTLHRNVGPAMPCQANPKGPYRVASLIALATLSLASNGCSTGGQHLTKTGFLSTSPTLKATKEQKNLVVWTAPGFLPSRYDWIIVEPVMWQAPPRAPEVQERLTAQFREALTNQLGSHYLITQEIGNRTLRVRAAITNLRRTRWYLNVPVQVATFATGGIGVFGPLQGGASEEIRVEDARSGDVLMQIATFRNGKPWNMMGSYVAYDHARMAFNAATRHLVDHLTPSRRTP